MTRPDGMTADAIKALLRMRRGDVWRARRLGNHTLVEKFEAEIKSLVALCDHGVAVQSVHLSTDSTMKRADGRPKYERNGTLRFCDVCKEILHYELPPNYFGAAAKPAGESVASAPAPSPDPIPPVIVLARALFETDADVVAHINKRAEAPDTVERTLRAYDIAWNRAQAGLLPEAAWRDRAIERAETQREALSRLLARVVGR